jgi:hypothetical protein
MWQLRRGGCFEGSRSQSKILRILSGVWIAARKLAFRAVRQRKERDSLPQFFIAITIDVNRFRRPAVARISRLKGRM